MQRFSVKERRRNGSVLAGGKTRPRQVPQQPVQPVQQRQPRVQPRRRLTVARLSEQRSPAGEDEPQPVLIAIDDAQWADGASLRFVMHLLIRVAELPLAVVVAVRPAAIDMEWSRYDDPEHTLRRRVGLGRHDHSTRRPNGSMPVGSQRPNSAHQPPGSAEAR